MNALDRAPQVPQDWANHIIWGGALGASVALAANLVANVPAADAWLYGTAASFMACAAKKSYQVATEGQPVNVAIGKTLFTALLPFCFYLGTFLK
jgi:hypothetical protein